MDLVDAADPDAVARAAAVLDQGQLVVLPGDLRYMLAADALDDDAVARLFVAQGRGADRPLTVCVAGHEDLHHVAYGATAAMQLVARHWPGPVALLFKARPWLPDALTAGGDTVGVNVPRDPFARELARHFGPFVVAGARRQGGADALDAASARRALGAEAQLYVDGGARPGGRLQVVDARA